MRNSDFSFVFDLSLLLLFVLLNALVFTYIEWGSPPIDLGLPVNTTAGGSR